MNRNQITLAFIALKTRMLRAFLYSAESELNLHFAVEPDYFSYISAVQTFLFDIACPVHDLCLISY